MVRAQIKPERWVQHMPGFMAQGCKAFITEFIDSVDNPEFDKRARRVGPAQDGGLKLDHGKKTFIDLLASRMVATSHLGALLLPSALRGGLLLLLGALRGGLRLFLGALFLPGA